MGQNATEQLLSACKPERMTAQRLSASSHGPGVHCMPKTAGSADETTSMCSRNRWRLGVEVIITWRKSFVANQRSASAPPSCCQDQSREQSGSRHRGEGEAVRSLVHAQ
ncbi:hypothetical protein FH972_023179 [Carpinus fangiana]|uniref:Uncharacterized protein n=1 Tax=Carpinus fangiana TaxID=176857 RepID=A0A5N6KUP6_9ROSI|nr:hypothetical protein FH972_023179 [Carpinus fangiana]